MKTTLSALSTLAGTLALTSLVSAQALTGLSFTGSSDGDVFPVGGSLLPFIADADDGDSSFTPAAASGQTGGGVLDGAARVASTRSVTSVTTVPLSRGSALPGIFIDIERSAFIAPGYAGTVFSAILVDVFFTLDQDTPFTEVRVNSPSVALSGPIDGSILRAGEYRLSINPGISLSSSDGLGATRDRSGRYELLLPAPGPALVMLGAGWLAASLRRRAG